MPRTLVALSPVVLIVVAIYFIGSWPARASAAGYTPAIRFVQALQDGRAVDVYIDGQQQVNWETLTQAKPPTSAVANQDERQQDNIKNFGKATSFEAVGPGKHHIQIVPSGSDLSAAYSLDLQIEQDRQYTVAAFGQQPNLKIMAIAEQIYTPAAGKAGVHVYHFSPDAPAVDLWLRVGAIRSDTPLVSNVAFGSTSGYRELEPGTYDLEALPASVNLPTLEAQSIQVQSGHVYSLFIINSLSTKSQLTIPNITVDKLPSQPAVLPKTSGQSTSSAELCDFAILMLVCGLVLRRYGRA
jgi:hypothetical protein